MRFGHNRNGKKSKPQLVYGVLTGRGGRPVAVAVDPGNTGDPATLPDQLDKLNTSEITAVHAAQADRNVSSINAEIIRCVRDAMDRQVDRQVPCTTPPHDRSGNGS